MNDDFAPVANVGGPYVINEGDSLTLNASASTDADDGLAGLTFRWDVDGDNDFDENITGVNPTLTPAQLAALGLADGAHTNNVTVEASDGTNIWVVDRDTNRIYPFGMEGGLPGPPAGGLYDGSVLAVVMSKGFDSGVPSRL